MSNAACNPCPCPTPVVTQVPGSPGTNGAAGTNGKNAFSTVQSPGFTVPAIGDSVSVPVDDNSWMVVNQFVFCFGAGTFQVNSLAGSTVAGLTYLNYVENTNAGNTISAGAQISPGGSEPNVSGLATAGANSDITSLTGLTTALSVAQGGTGETTLPALLTALTVQAGSKLLASGTGTVNTPNITASSIVVVTLITPGGTRTGFAGYKVTALTPGTPGSFVITAIDDSASTLGSCTDTVAWHVIL